jgi:hypothetical protein
MTIKNQHLDSLHIKFVFSSCRDKTQERINRQTLRSPYYAIILCIFEKNIKNAPLKKPIPNSPLPITMTEIFGKTLQRLTRDSNRPLGLRREGW